MDPLELLALEVYEHVDRDDKKYTPPFLSAYINKDIVKTHLYSRKALLRSMKITTLATAIYVALC